MSNIESVSITCPHCKGTYDGVIYESINRILNPELVDKLVDGSINTYICEHCKGEFKLNYPILFNHSSFEGALFVYYTLGNPDDIIKQHKSLSFPNFGGMFSLFASSIDCEAYNDWGTFINRVRELTKRGIA